MIDAGACVILYLGSPREQVFGIVVQINASGVVVRGLSLGSAEDWMRELTPETVHEIAPGALSTTFYPMHRIEKVSLDEPAYGAPALHERFRRRTGAELTDVAFIGTSPAVAAKPRRSARRAPSRRRR